MPTQVEIIRACSCLGIESLNLLGVGGEGGATKQLKRLYFQRAKSHHPDKITDPALKIIATNKMASINESYHLLLKVLEKRQQDQDAEAAAKNGASSSAFFSSSSSSSFSTAASSSSSSSTSSTTFPRAAAGFRRPKVTQRNGSRGNVSRPSDILRQWQTSAPNRRTAAPVQPKDNEAERRKAAMNQQLRVQKMLEETKRKKQRMKDQRDQLMSQYHQIRSYLSRMQHPLIDATTETLDIDSSVLRELQRRLSQLPGCVQDDRVVSARQDVGVMIRDSVAWVQKAHHALSMSDVAHRYKFCHHLRKLAQGTRSKRGVAAPIILQRQINKQYNICEIELTQGTQSVGSSKKGSKKGSKSGRKNGSKSGLKSGAGFRSKTSSKRRASSIKKKRKRRSAATAGSVKRQRAQHTEDMDVDETEEHGDGGNDVMEESSSEEEEEETSSEEEAEEEEMELLSPTCVDRGWRIEYTNGETWFVAPHTTIRIPNVTSFATVQDADLFEVNRFKRSQMTSTQCLKEIKEEYAVTSTKTHTLTAEERREKWMSQALSHANELKKGDTVDVMRRKWPGINKEGGRARVTSIHLPIIGSKKKGKKKGGKSSSTSSTSSSSSNGDMMSLELRARTMAYRQMPKVNGGWSCQACTLINKTMSDEQCGVCDTYRSDPPNEILQQCMEEISLDIQREKEQEEIENKKREYEASIFAMQFDVSYILGGREKNLDAKYVRIAKGEIGHYGSEEEEDEEDKEDKEMEQDGEKRDTDEKDASTNLNSNSNAKEAEGRKGKVDGESLRTSSRSNGSKKEVVIKAGGQGLTLDELEDLARGMYDDLVQQSLQIRHTVENEIYKTNSVMKEMIEQTKSATALSSSSSSSFLSSTTSSSSSSNEELQKLALQLRRQSKRMLRLVADIDGVHIAYKKVTSDEVKLSGGVSREHVNVPKRMEEMMMFCLKKIAKATTKKEEDDEEEEEDEGAKETILKVEEIEEVKEIEAVVAKTEEEIVLSSSSQPSSQLEDDEDSEIELVIEEEEQPVRWDQAHDRLIMVLIKAIGENNVSKQTHILNMLGRTMEQCQARISKLSKVCVR